MIFLILTILSSTGIFAVFRFIDKFSISTFSVIIINYIIAVIVGTIFILGGRHLPNSIEFSSLLSAILIGVLFIVMFYVIGKSTQRAGITPTTVASKMSVVLPITFSIIIDPTDYITPVKLTGILLAIPALLLTIYKPDKVKDLSVAFYLPLILFIGMGLVDSMVKLAQEMFIEINNELFFSTLVFFFAAITGLITAGLKKHNFRQLGSRKVLVWGSLLGVFNFGSIYFILKALNFTLPGGERMDGSVVFAVSNMGIVVLSVLTGFVIFKERPLAVNWFGVALSIAAIYILGNW